MKISCLFHPSACHAMLIYNHIHITHGSMSSTQRRCAMCIFVYVLFWWNKNIIETHFQHSVMYIVTITVNVMCWTRLHLTFLSLSLSPSFYPYKRLFVFFKIKSYILLDAMLTMKIQMFALYLWRQRRQRRWCSYGEDTFECMSYGTLFKTIIQNRYDTSNVHIDRKNVCKPNCNDSSSLTKTSEF